MTYSIYLAKLFGPYATLGLAEDTWALNEEVLDDQAFLAQCYGNHQDRERMFFVKHYFGADWPTRSLYHMMINTAIGDETVISTILHTMRTLGERTSVRTSM